MQAKASYALPKHMAEASVSAEGKMLVWKGWNPLTAKNAELWFIGERNSK